MTQVARTLAAHGGGAISVDLAFDLVLHEVVSQAREASGASGAAIALMRDGEMVCRATTGDHAPDLGVRVETSSGLAGACLRTGEVQQCRDTETDNRVNPEAARRLGVRSMVIAPLSDGEKLFGILQAFSATPNAFGKREVSALQVVAQRIAESKREVDTGTAAVSTVDEESFADREASASISDHRRRRESEAPVPLDRYEQPRSEPENDFLSSLLVVLVVAAAVALGVAIGWHAAVQGTVKDSATGSQVVKAATPVRNEPSTMTLNETAASEPSSAAPRISNQPAAGGLLITEGGKVVYRTPAVESSGRRRATASPERPSTRLIHRVEPEYPADARAQHLQGAVVLDVEILGTGEVAGIEIVSGNPVLAAAAIQAVRRWRYQPYSVNREPVRSQARITITFTMPAS